MNSSKKRVDKHNSLIERTYAIEQHNAVVDEEIKVANHRIVTSKKSAKERIKKFRKKFFQPKNLGRSIRRSERFKTVAQTAIATIGVSAVMTDVNWLAVGSASLLAGVLSVLTSIAGLPEVSEN